jgi:hypothetical protein
MIGIYFVEILGIYKGFAVCVVLQIAFRPDAFCKNTVVLAKIGVNEN